MNKERFTLVTEEKQKNALEDIQQQIKNLQLQVEKNSAIIEFIKRENEIFHHNKNDNKK